MALLLCFISTMNTTAEMMWIDVGNGFKENQKLIRFIFYLNQNYDHMGLIFFEQVTLILSLSSRNHLKNEDGYGRAFTFFVYSYMVCGMMVGFQHRFLSVETCIPV